MHRLFLIWKNRNPRAYASGNSRRENKKIAGLLIILSLCLFGIGGFFVWEKFFRPFKEDAAKEVETKRKIEGIEEQIAETRKRLEEVSKLSPEEIKKREEERRILSAKKATEDVLVEGIEVAMVGETKKISNRIEGYRIDVPSNLVIARTVSSDWVELHDRTGICEDPSCDPALRIRSQKSNPDKLFIEEWLAIEEKKSGKPLYSPRQKLTISGETVFKVKEEIPPIFDGFYYYWAHGEKIYSIRVSIFDDEIYRSSIDTFIFE